MNRNIKKTLYYLKRNGIKTTYYAVQERLEERKQPPYQFEPIKLEELQKQQQELSVEELPLISIVVPAYHTPEAYCKAMIESVLAQSYPNWELIIADASEDQSVSNVAKLYQDLRIEHIPLQDNKGISENTNQGIRLAKGDYIALLDHDDVITPDALYELYQPIKNSDTAVMVYSDEDKCNEDASIYFDVHRKLDFNKDLLLTNNYICHFTMIQANVLKELLLRKDYDGAQDFDLFLRVMEYAKNHKREICHVAKVLYHWRSHELSTAANPQSKSYAYEAGKKAIQDYYDRNGILAKVTETSHVGFYQTEYDCFKTSRLDIGAVAHKWIKKNKIVGTVFDNEEHLLWNGMNANFSGYLHRAKLQQDVGAANLFSLSIRKQYLQGLISLIDELIKNQTKAVSYFDELKDILKTYIENTEILDIEFVDMKELFEKNPYLRKAMKEHQNELEKLSIAFGQLMKKQGLLIFYEPAWRVTWKN